VKGRVERTCCGDPRPWRWRVVMPTAYGEEIAHLALTRAGARWWQRRHQGIVSVV